MEGFMMFEPEREIKFEGSCTTHLQAEMKMTNTSDQRVCFKIKTTAPKQYTVRPRCGSLDPGNHTIIKITLLPFEICQGWAYADNVIIQSLPMPDDCPRGLDDLRWQTDASNIKEKRVECKFDIMKDNMQIFEDEQQRRCLVLDTEISSKRRYLLADYVVDQIDADDLIFLAVYDLILFVDLDNWGRFFQNLLERLPTEIFVYGVFGGGTAWKIPKNCLVYDDLDTRGSVRILPQCGRSTQAADLTLTMQLGMCHSVLPKKIVFAVVSNDKGFLELGNQGKERGRSIVVVDPKDPRYAETALFTKLCSLIPCEL